MQVYAIENRSRKLIIIYFVSYVRNKMNEKMKYQLKESIIRKFLPKFIDILTSFNILTQAFTKHRDKTAVFLRRRWKNEIKWVQYKYWHWEGISDLNLQIRLIQRPFEFFHLWHGIPCRGSQKKSQHVKIVWMRRIESESNCAWLGPLHNRTIQVVFFCIEFT